ncbi:MAG TPA: hypothetical protein VFO14_01440 [Vicinamibacterales bacterium]|nr:hypothetical protein [Vicinamibacterales bacterium]
MTSKPSRIAGSTLLVVGLAGTALGCSEGNPARPSPVRSEAAAMPPLTWPTSDIAFPVGPELAALRRATAAYHDISRAFSAGYTIENEPCVSSPAGAMGIHAPNPSLLEEFAVDPARPELLLYEPMPNGGHRLVGVEFFQVALLRRVGASEDPAPRFDSTPWDPTEYEVVNPAPQLFSRTFHLSPPPAPGVPWHYALHVWVWAHNPSGMFADWNPRVRCP